MEDRCIHKTAPELCKRDHSKTEMNQKEGYLGWAVYGSNTSDYITRDHTPMRHSEDHGVDLR